MIDTIMFDLDGTLARFHQEEFINVYFKELSKVFIKLGLDADVCIKAVWAGTKAMVLNDGTVLNSKRFWDAFSAFMDLHDEQLKSVEDACNRFYANEFNAARSVVKQSDVPKRLVRAIAARGYNTVLATNPLFPLCAVDSRLEWIDLDRSCFMLITHYENSTFCKPNPAYYREVLSRIGKSPEQCLMVGNNPAEDMCVSKLGMEVFLVTDFMENESGLDFTVFRHGTIDELEEFLMSLPELP